jgi:hypothetical protein
MQGITGESLTPNLTTSLGLYQEGMPDDHIDHMIAIRNDE